MSAALTHVAVGLLLGLAVRLPLRYVPITGFLALLPDLDHLDQYGPLPLPFVETRVTFHNVWFCVALPLAIYLWCEWKVRNDDVRRLAAAAPLALSSHLFLDTLPLDISSPRVPLFWPLVAEPFTIAAIRGYAVDPTAYSTLTLLVLILVTLSVVTVSAIHLGRSPRASLSRRWAVPGAFALLWILVFPGLAAGGFVVPAGKHPDTILAVEDPTLQLPSRRATAVIAHLGGNDVAKGALRLEVLLEGARVAAVTNPEILARGDRWAATVAVPGAAEAYTLRLSATGDDHAYAEQTLRVVKGHVPVTLRVDAFTHDGRGTATLRLANDGAVEVPAGAVRLVVARGGSEIVNATNERALAAGATWTVTHAVPLGPNAPSHRIVATATLDGYTYVRVDRAPELSAVPALPPRVTL